MAVNDAPKDELQKRNDALADTTSSYRDGHASGYAEGIADGVRLAIIHDDWAIAHALMEKGRKRFPEHVAEEMERRNIITDQRGVLVLNPKEKTR